MKAVTKILLGGAGFAALAAVAAPAAAQYGYGYPGYGNQYGYGQGNVVGSILNTILGGRSYAQNDRYAVEQCVRAVEHRINTQGFDNERGRYRNYAYGYGYDNQYRNYQGARVLNVTEVRRRSNGGLKVIGLATTGMQAGYGYNNGYNGYNNYGGGYGGQYGYNNGYGYNQAVADARFDCSVDRYGRIVDIDANRYRSGYNSNYGYRRY